MAMVVSVSLDEDRNQLALAVVGLVLVLVIIVMDPLEKALQEDLDLVARHSRRHPARNRKHRFQRASLLAAFAILLLETNESMLYGSTDKD